MCSSFSRTSAGWERLTMAVGCLRGQDPETRLFASSANVSKPEVGLPSCLSLILIFVKPTSSQPAQPAAQITRIPPKPKPCSLGFRPGCSCALRVLETETVPAPVLPHANTHSVLSLPARQLGVCARPGRAQAPKPEFAIIVRVREPPPQTKTPPAASPRLLANNASKWPPPASDHVHVHPCPCPSLGASQ